VDCACGEQNPMLYHQVDRIAEGHGNLALCGRSQHGCFFKY
jgi:hypothetical protein